MHLPQPQAPPSPNLTPSSLSLSFVFSLGVAAGSEVFYSVGTARGGWSGEHAFTAFDPGRATSRLLLTADMGLGYGDRSLYHWPCPRALATATHLVALAAAGGWNAVLHVGDIAYGTGYAPKVGRKEVVGGGRGASMGPAAAPVAGRAAIVPHCGDPCSNGLFFFFNLPPVASGRGTASWKWWSL